MRPAARVVPPPAGRYSFLEMAPALLHLVLAFALLHAQAPCHPAAGPAPGRDAGTAAADPPARTAACCCCCHADDGDVGPDPAATEAPGPAPAGPPGCPRDCPCLVCSPGFVPLTDFGCATLPAGVALDPPLIPTAPTRGHAGHHQLPDRPPRLA